jgi:hypothetical protein
VGERGLPGDNLREVALAALLACLLALRSNQGPCGSQPSNVNGKLQGLAAAKSSRLSFLPAHYLPAHLSVPTRLLVDLLPFCTTIPPQWSLGNGCKHQ